MNDTTTQPPADEPLTPDDLSAAFSSDPELGKAVSAALDGPAKPRPRNVGGSLGDMWTKLVAQSPVNKASTAIARGALQAADQTSNAIVGAATTISKKTGLYKLGRSPEEQQAFLKAWEKPTDESNPLQFGQERIDRWLGPKQGGVYDLITGLSQFATGMAAASKVLGPIGGATKAGQVVANVAKGAAVDATVFDPHQGRLADLVQGTALANPVTALLAGKGDDTELEGRIKNGLEGAVVGGTVDLVLGGIKALRALKAGDSEGAKSIMHAAEEKAATPQPHDVAAVSETPDGHFEVHPVQSREIVDPGASSGQPEASPQAPKFTSRADAENAAATLNFANANHVAGTTAETVPHVDPRGFQRAYSILSESGDVVDAADALQAYGFNPKYVQSPEEVVNTIKAMVEAAPEASTIARGRPKADADVIEGAKELFGTATDAEAMQRASEVFDKTDSLDEHIVGMRLWQQSHAANVRKLSMLADANPENAVAVEQLSQALDTMHDFHAYLTGTSANSGRALRAHQFTVGADGTITSPKGSGVGAEGVAPETTQSITDGLSKTEIRDLARSIFMADGDPAEILGVIRGTKATKQATEELAGDPSLGQKVRNIAMAGRMEAMLSAVPTHAGNAVSNTLAMLQRPAEYWWAGVRSGNPELRQMAADMYDPAGLWMDIRDSFGALKKSFVTGSNVIDSSDPHGVGSLPDLSGDIQAKTALSALLRMPSRMLMSSDEFFKNMNYRMNVRAQILRQAREQGVTDAAELSRRLTDQAKFAYDPEGGAANPWALQYARTGTFTNDLGAGTVGQHALDFVQQHPVMRLIVPFVKTPINLFRYAWERTPGLNTATAAWRADLASGDPERIAVAKSKAELGALVWGAGAYLAYTKTITGGGPADPALREQLKAAGWQPYSMKIGDRYVSYRRGDPVFTAFSVMADVVEMSTHMQQGDLEQLIPATMAGIASSVTSKTFLQGLSDTFEALGNRSPHKMAQLESNLLGSFIPNILRKQDPDPVIHETRSLADEMRSRVPGFSSTLEPKRNLFGDPVLRPPGYMNTSMNPFTVSGKVELEGNVLNELTQLGKAMPMPAEVRDGMNLTDRETFNDRKRADGQYQSPYDRWLELMGTTGLKSRLSDLVQSPHWGNYTDDMKLTVAGAYVQAAQEEAYGKMLQEYPSVRRGMAQQAEIHATALGGGDVNSVIDKYGKLFVKVHDRPKWGVK